MTILQRDVYRDVENDQDRQEMALPLHNVPPEPAPPLHPLPSLSSCHSPQTTTLAARGRSIESPRPKGQQTCIEEREYMQRSVVGGKKVSGDIVFPTAPLCLTPLFRLPCHHHYPQRFTRNVVSAKHNATHCRGWESIEILPCRNRWTRELHLET